MAAYGQAATQALPVVNSTFGPTYATMINAALSELRATLGAKVTPAGIDVNADLSLRSGASYYGLINAHRVGLNTQAAGLSAATYPGALYAGVGGELFYNDSAGNQVALTLAGSVTGAAGNIDGTGYGATGVSITWDAANALYSLFSGAGTYADAKIDDLLLNDGDTNFLRMTASAMASDYTLTWPAAVPASSNSVITVSTAGALAFSATPTLTSVTTTGVGVIGSTLSAAGLITATAGLTAGANTHLTISGTGRLKHGSMQKVIGSAAFAPSDYSDSVFLSGLDSCTMVQTEGVMTFRGPIDLPVGARVTAVTFRTIHGISGSARTYALCYSVTGGGSRVVHTSGTDTTNNGNVAKTVTIGGSGETFVNSRQYWLEFITAVTGDGITMALVTYDFP